MYIEQAFKGLHESWRYVVGVLLIFLVGWQLIGAIPISVVSLLQADGLADLENSLTSNFASLYPEQSNLYLFLVLSTFIGGIIVLYLTVKYFHKLSFTAFTTVRKKVDWGRVFFGFFLIAIPMLLFTLADFYFSPEDYVLQFEIVPFLIMAAICIVFIPIQTSFEEYFFRGYLMQGIGVSAKNKWLPLVITSVIFGGMHLINPEVEKLGYIVSIYYIGTGFFLGIIALMDDGLELALGFHAGNNLVIALLVTTDWTVFQTHSIFKDISEPAAGFDVIMPVLILYPIYLAILAYRYKWKNWNEKLFGKVKPPVIDVEIQTL